MCLKALPPRLTGLMSFITGLWLIIPLAGHAALNAPVPLDVSQFFHTNFLAAGYKGPGTSIPRNHTVDGLPFQITGQAAFYGRTLADRGTLYMERADGIVVGRTFQELHVVHHAFWMDAEGQPIAVIRLNYADGSTADFPVRYGAQVRDWFKLPSEPKEAMADPNTIIFWRGTHPSAERLKATMRIFKSKFLNPHPDRIVGTISVISTRQQASYSLLAMTIAGTDANRPKTTPAAPLEAEPEFDGAIKITVLDADTGRPIAGARLEPGMSVNGAGVISPVLVTSESGEQTIRYPTKTTAYVSTSVHAEGYTPARSSWQNSREGIPAEHTFRLKPGQIIGGWVRDETGTPVSAARLNLSGQTADGNYFSTGYESDQEGRWTGTGPKTLEGLTLEVLHRDFPSARYVTSASFSSAGETVLDMNLLRSGNAVILLSRGIEVTGVVHDESGGPITNATLRFSNDSRTRNASTAKTDEQGAFTLKKIRPSSGLLTVQAPNCAPHEQVLEVRAGMEPLVIVLGKGNTIRGLVVDEAGNPVEDVDVSLVTEYRPDGGMGIQWKGKTDVDGRFNWGAAPDKEVRLSFRKSGFRSLTKSVKPSAEVQTFILGGTQRVFGTVVDAQSGEAVPNFRLTPGWRVNYRGMPKDTNAIPRASWQDYQSKTFTNGKFDFPITDSPYGQMINADVDLFIRVDAEGYAPSITPAIKSDDLRTEVQFELARAEATSGKLVNADGTVASNVVLHLVFPHGNGAQFNSGKLVSFGSSGRTSLRTDHEGQFKIPPQLGDFLVAAETSLGIGTIDSATLKATGVLQLKPWARVEGVWKNGKRPVSGGALGMGISSIQRSADQSKPRLYVYLNTTTSRDGTFHFDRVPPGSLELYERVPMGQNSYSHRTLKPVEVLPGVTNVVVIGSEGVLEITGQLIRPEGLAPTISLTNGNFEIRRAVSPPSVPKDLKEPKDIQAWFNDWMKTPEGKEYVIASQEAYTVSVTPSGRLSADGLKPGKYVLSAMIRERSTSQAARSAVLASVSREFELKAPENGKEAEPHDLGKITLRLHRNLKVGDKAPEFSIKTVDGAALKLSDFKGKFVLLDFWATWCGPCVAELPHLKETFEKHGSNQRFAMIGLSLDSDPEAPKAFATKNGVKWIQGFLGDWSKASTPKDYGVEGIPSLFLINPEGKIAALEFRGEDIEPTVAKALQSAR